MSYDLEWSIRLHSVPSFSSFPLRRCCVNIYRTILPTCCWHHLKNKLASSSSRPSFWRWTRWIADFVASTPKLKNMWRDEFDLDQHSGYRLVQILRYVFQNSSAGNFQSKYLRSHLCPARTFWSHCWSRFQCNAGKRVLCSSRPSSVSQQLTRYITTLWRLLQSRQVWLPACRSKRLKLFMDHF